MANAIDGNVANIRVVDFVPSKGSGWKSTQQLIKQISIKAGAYIHTFHDVWAMERSRNWSAETGAVGGDFPSTFAYSKNAGTKKQKNVTFNFTFLITNDILCFYLQ